MSSLKHNLSSLLHPAADNQVQPQIKFVELFHSSASIMPPLPQPDRDKRQEEAVPATTMIEPTKPDCDERQEKVVPAEPATTTIESVAQVGFEITASRPGESDALTIGAFLPHEEISNATIRNEHGMVFVSGSITVGKLLKGLEQLVLKAGTAEITALIALNRRLRVQLFHIDPQRACKPVDPNKFERALRRQACENGVQFESYSQLADGTWTYAFSLDPSEMQATKKCCQEHQTVLQDSAPLVMA